LWCRFLLTQRPFLGKKPLRQVTCVGLRLLGSGQRAAFVSQVSTSVWKVWSPPAAVPPTFVALTL
jgi:hypothetical protein